MTQKHLSKKQKRIFISFILIMIFLPWSILFYKYSIEIKESDEMVSCGGTLRFLYMAAKFYQDDTGRNIYNEVDSIQDLINLEEQHGWSPEFFKLLRRDLKKRKYVLYLIKSGNSDSGRSPVILCHLYNGRCILMTSDGALYTDLGKAFRRDVLFYGNNRNSCSHAGTEEFSLSHSSAPPIKVPQGKNKAIAGKSGEE